MTENESEDKEFWSRADKFIDVANKLCSKTDVGKVTSSMLYAAARFNAFMVFANAENAEEMKGEKNTALEYFSDRYKKMLEENLDEHIENFNKYSENSA